MLIVPRYRKIYQSFFGSVFKQSSLHDSDAIDNDKVNRNAHVNLLKQYCLYPMKQIKCLHQKPSEFRRVSWWLRNTMCWILPSVLLWESGIHRTFAVPEQLRWCKPRMDACWLWCTLCVYPTSLNIYDIRNKPYLSAYKELETIW